MSPNEITLSGMLWLCAGFLIGYRYHVLKVRWIIRKRGITVTFPGVTTERLRKLSAEIEKINKRDCIARLP